MPKCVCRFFFSEKIGGAKWLTNCMFYNRMLRYKNKNLNAEMSTQICMYHTVLESETH